jgi:hypothetical protein
MRQAVFEFFGLSSYIVGIYVFFRILAEVIYE